jgi:glycosyltransferase involved in cell wall biosynthesis
LLLTDLQLGGTPTVVRELAKRLAREQTVRVHVACLDSWGAVAEQIKSMGVPVTALGGGKKWDAGIFSRLLGLIRRGQFDTVLSFLMHANAAAAGASLTCRRVRFLQSIQTTQPWPRWHWVVQGMAARRAEMIVVPSPSVTEAAGKWALIPAEKIVVIPNSVDVGEFAAIRKAREIGKRIGFIGRLDPVKRIGDLVAALPRVGDEATLHIFGEGVERPRIEAEIERLGLGGRAILHGAVAGPAVALAGIDVLVLPSVAEGFGLVLIEAMAAGVAVVATDVPGIADVVQDGVNGLLAAVANPAELARAILRVLGDDGLRERLVAGGRRAVRERYSWERVFPMWRRVLGLVEGQGHAD